MLPTTYRAGGRRRVLGLAAALGLALVPASAGADDAPAAPPADDRASASPGDEGDARERIRRPSRAHGATVARIVAPTFARQRLRSPRPRRRVSTATAWSGQSQTLLVLAARRHGGRDWLRVLLADRPNGSSGWIPRDRAVLGKTRYWIDIRLGPRRVVVRRDGRPVRRFRAVIGAPPTPSPSGLAAIYERNRQPDPQAFLGPWVLALTTHSNVLENFGGGPGRVGIHGRSGASLRDPLGSARSHGCIRVDNRDVGWMAAKIPLGTPVMVRP